MKIINKKEMTGIAGVLLLAVQVGAHAAPLDLDLFFGDPTFRTTGARIAYDYDEVGGSGGTLTIGFGGPTNTTMIEASDITSSISADPFGNPFTNGGYELTAQFNSAGVFQPAGSNVKIIGYSVLPGGFGATLINPFFSALTLAEGGADGGSGLIIEMDLTEFGYTGTSLGALDNVEFEWKADIVGGDFAALGFSGPSGGVITGGNIAYGSTDGSTPGSYNAGGWEYLGLGDTTAFTADFGSCVSGCPLLLETFVPVPAAVWLFGSGLIGLIGMGRRRC